jgi:hypothetical protein
VRIVLATLNARYSHASFGLRYLFANLGDLRAQARMLEFELRQPVDDIVTHCWLPRRRSWASASTSGTWRP